MKLTSPAFENNSKIPKIYTCDGEDINPPLEIENVPDSAKSLVLIMDDPDAPAGTWDHWVVWNISFNTKEIIENSVPENAIQGLTSFGDNKYGGPCPPPGLVHHYAFKLYALDREFNISLSSRKEDVEKAMNGHILADAKLIGLYSR